MWRLSHIFLSALLLGIVTQSVVLQHIPYIDHSNWVTEVAAIQGGNLFDRSRLFYGYPGTALTVPAALVSNMGIPVESALAGCLSFLIAVTGAAVATVSYYMRPTSLWWIAVSGLLLFHRLYALSTPPSALVAPLVVLLVLLTILIHERFSAITKWPLILLGIVGGIGLATRLDISLAILGSCLLFLLPQIRWRLGYIIGCAAITFIALNPYMWVFPLQHLLDIYHKITTHFYEMQAMQPFHLILLRSPLTVGALGLAALTLLFPQIPRPFSRKIILWLFFTTAIITTILRRSHYQPSWYFYPLFFIWETLFPLFLLTLIEHLPPLPIHWLTSRRIQFFVVSLLIGGQLLMLLHVLSLPEVIFVLPVE